MTYKLITQSDTWQYRRQEVLKRDNYTCQECQQYSTNLHIHHLTYRYVFIEMPNGLVKFGPFFA